MCLRAEEHVWHGIQGVVARRNRDRLDLNPWQQLLEEQLQLAPLDQCLSTSMLDGSVAATRHFYNYPESTQKGSALPKKTGQREEHSGSLRLRDAGRSGLVILMAIKEQQ